jgi:hypothetical protein
MYGRANDRAFITTMGFDTTAFKMMLEPFKRLWDTTPIPRGDVNAETAQIHLNKRSLDAAGALVGDPRPLPAIIIQGPAVFRSASSLSVGFLSVRSRSLLGQSHGKATPSIRLVTQKLPLSIRQG